MKMLKFGIDSIPAKNFDAQIILRSLSLLVIGLLCSLSITTKLQGQACTADLKAEQVLGDDVPALAVGIRWAGLNGAPSVDDPSLVGEDNFKDMLWRRHERASECIWIPQCRITLRSAMGIQSSDYIRIDDIDDPAIVDDQPGDVVVRVNGARDYSELRQLWQNADLEFGNLEKGLLALSVGRFINRDGNTAEFIGISGVALNYDDVSTEDVIERPAIAVIDPTYLSDPDTEEVLAHEVGHKLGLCHTDDDCSVEEGNNDNLMTPAVSSILLTEDQCEKARERLENSTQLDPPVESGTVLGLIDAAQDVEEPNIPNHLDIRKLVVVDDAERGAGLTLALRLEGPLAINTGRYLFALNIDNDESTGAPLSAIVPGATMTGVDVVFQASANENNATFGIRVAEGGSFSSLDATGISGSTPTVMVEEIGPDALPPTALSSDIIFRVTPEALANVGIVPVNDRFFPNGLAIQAAALESLPDGGEVVDLGPDAVAVLDFPDLDYPSIEVGGPVCRGDILPIRVSGLPPNSPIKAFLGENLFMPNVETDSLGAALFSITVPNDVVSGPTLLTVGIVHETNAVTADAVISLCPDNPIDRGQKLNCNYSAKIICGKQGMKANLNLSRGQYATTINVFNPGSEPVILSKNLALAVPPGNEKAGRVYRIAHREMLFPGRAMAIQCEDIIRSTFPNGLPASYVDGFVSIHASGELTVKGVYTTATLDAYGEPENVQTLHIQKVEGSCPGGCKY